MNLQTKTAQPMELKSNVIANGQHLIKQSSPYVPASIQLSKASTRQSFVKPDLHQHAVSEPDHQEHVPTKDPSKKSLTNVEIGDTSYFISDNDDMDVSVNNVKLPKSKNDANDIEEEIRILKSEQNDDEIESKILKLEAYYKDLGKNKTLSDDPSSKNNITKTDEEDVNSAVISEGTKNKDDMVKIDEDANNITSKVEPSNTVDSTKSDLDVTNTTTSSIDLANQSDNKTSELSNEENSNLITEELSAPTIDKSNNETVEDEELSALSKNEISQVINNSRNNNTISEFKNENTTAIEESGGSEKNGFFTDTNSYDYVDEEDDEVLTSEKNVASREKVRDSKPTKSVKENLKDVFKGSDERENIGKKTEFAGTDVKNKSTSQSSSAKKHASNSALDYFKVYHDWKKQQKEIEEGKEPESEDKTKDRDVKEQKQVSSKKQCRPCSPVTVGSYDKRRTIYPSPVFNLPQTYRTKQNFLTASGPAELQPSYAAAEIEHNEDNLLPCCRDLVTQKPNSPECCKSSE